MFKRMYLRILRFFLSPVIRDQRIQNEILHKGGDWQCGWNDRTIKRISGIDSRIIEIEGKIEEHKKLINGLADRLGLTIFNGALIGTGAIDERPSSQRLTEALESNDGFAVIDILRNELAPRSAKTEAQANSFNSDPASRSDQPESFAAGA
ncbi:MAG: hypothetical protein WBA83_16755 [Burkholderiaceae bacterium]